MIKSAVARTPILAFILMFFALGYTVAHNKVVVVPLGADAGVSGYEVVTNSVTSNLGTNFGESLIANCPSGKKAIGGGASNSHSRMIVNDNQPYELGVGWIATSFNRAEFSVFNFMTV